DDEVVERVRADRAAIGGRLPRRADVRAFDDGEPEAADGVGRAARPVGAGLARAQAVRRALGPGGRPRGRGGPGPREGPGVPARGLLSFASRRRFKRGSAGSHRVVHGWKDRTPVRRRRASSTGRYHPGVEIVEGGAYVWEHGMLREHLVKSVPRDDAKELHA